MSVDFYVEGNEERVWNMGNGSARNFVVLTKAIAECYEVEVPVTEIRGSECIIAPLLFFDLVEKVFAMPNSMFHSWAQMAAAIYEALKGEFYVWRWPCECLPYSVFTPMRHENFDSERFSGKTMGMSHL